ncbi:MAG: ubiquinone/menaquinone biosynthesis methyltransferase [Anaerolineae bacterium]|nr:ubiquinone/menaquinone biosynthesis methyltransferase [Anaerolineae bacterium]
MSDETAPVNTTGSPVNTTGSPVQVTGSPVDATGSPRSGQQQKASIRELFTRIASHYDVVNRVLAVGQDQRWRRVALAYADLSRGGRLLDVATGTGDLALLARELEDVTVIGTDLTYVMLARAQRKAAMRATDASLPWVVSDGLALAFPDEAFDAVTSAFMMRNVPDVAQAFREQLRVVKPGGKVVCLEITWPQTFPMRWLFGLYFFGLPPLLGRLMVGEHEPYRYLPRSVQRFLQPAALAEVMVQAGLRDVVWRTMMLGTVAVHVGTR